MGPVLLLDVGVVVLLVRPTPSELDVELLAVAVQMVVDELGAVVRVDTSQLKGASLANLLKRLHHEGLALAHDSLSLRPTGVDVGQGEGVDELSLGPIPRVRHQIDLREARLAHLPPSRPDGNLVLEQSPRFGLAVEPSLRLRLVGPEPTVDLAGADPQQLALQPRRDRDALLEPRQPQRQQCLQPHRPRVVRRLPHQAQRVIHRLAIARPTKPTPGRPPLGSRAVQTPHRVLAVIARHPANLVQNPTLLRPIRLPVPRPDPAQILPPSLSSQVVPPARRVTSQMARRTPLRLHLGRRDTFP